MLLLLDIIKLFSHLSHGDNCFHGVLTLSGLVITKEAEDSSIWERLQLKPLSLLKKCHTAKLSRKLKDKLGADKNETLNRLYTGA